MRSTRAIVEVLFVGTCHHWRAAVDLVRTAMTGREERYELHLVCVSSIEQARELGFAGSPTIRVNGRDIEGDVSDREPCLQHRVYRVAQGTARIPDLHVIHDALDRADATSRDAR